MTYELISRQKVVGWWKGIWVEQHAPPSLGKVALIDVGSSGYLARLVKDMSKVNRETERLFWTFLQLLPLG